MTREHHCAFYTTFLQQREARLKGEGQKDALAEIGEEMENVRAGWQWAVQNEGVAFIDGILEGLYLCYEMRGRFHEGEEAFKKAAQGISDWEWERNEKFAIHNPQSAIVLAKVLARQGWFCHRQDLYGQDRELLERGLAIARHLGERAEMGFCLNSLGNVAYLQGEYAEAVQRLWKSLAIRREIGDRWGMAHTLNSLGNVAYDQGDYAAARQRYQESLALFEEAGDQRGMAISLNNLGNVARMLGEYTEAKQLYHESLALKRELSDRLGIAYALNNLGYVTSHYLGEHEEARELLQESLALFKELGDRRGTAYVLNNLGDVAWGLGEYTAVKQLYHEGLAIRREIGNQFGIAYSLSRLGNVACALQQFEESKHRFQEALRIAMDIQAVSLAVGILAGIAALLIAEGEKERALELLLLALHHPAADGETKDRAERLLSELTPELPRQVIAAAEERAAGKDLAAIVEDMLSR